MNKVHLESALHILRAHATERPHCERTQRLIEMTARRLAAPAQPFATFRSAA